MRSIPSRRATSISSPRRQTRARRGARINQHETGFSGKGRIMTAGRVATWMTAVIAGLGVVALPAQAQKVGPANLTVVTARVIVPDGSSLKQAVGGVGETHWFVFGTEPGKTYVVEAVDTDDDLAANTIGTLNVYAADGTTTPAVETSLDCTANTRAPALEVAAVDGKRCVVRTFPPSPGNTQ